MTSRPTAKCLFFSAIFLLACEGLQAQQQQARPYEPGVDGHAAFMRPQPAGPNAVAATRPLGYLPTNVVNTVTPYVDLGTTGTRIRTPNNNDDDYSAAQPIGFNFRFRGKDFTTFVLNTNGFIVLGSDPASVPDLFFQGNQSYAGGALYSPAQVDTNLIAPFNVDLIDSDSGIAEYRSRTTGTAPNRVCTIQWKNVKDKVGTQLSRAAFQVKLYETTNFVEFVYGRFASSTDAPVFRSAGIGIRGGGSQVLFGSKYSGDPWDRTVFLTDPNGVNQHNYRNSFMPDFGRTYRFTTTLPNNVGIAGVLGFPGAACNQGIVDSVGVIVANTGSARQTQIPVTLKVDRNGQFTGTIAQLDSGDRDTLYFRNIDFTRPGNYGVTAFTSLVGDMLKGNDTLRPDSVQNIVPRPADGSVNSFEDERSLQGWVSYNSNRDSFVWTLTEDAGRAHSGLRFLRLANSVNGSNDWLISGCYGLLGRHRYKVRFYVTNLNDPVTSGASKVALVALRAQSPDTAGTGARVVWDDDNITTYRAQGYMDTTVYFYATDTAAYYLAWHVYSSRGSNILALDDVSLDTAAGLLPLALPKPREAGYRIVPNPSGAHGFAVEGLLQNTPALLVDALGRRRELMLRKEEGYRVPGGMAPGLYSLQVGSRVLRLAVE